MIGRRGNLRVTRFVEMAGVGGYEEDDNVKKS